MVFYTIALLAITLLAHPVPLYYVETDLVGEYIPAAQALAAGRVALEHHSFKGPGYPLLLALAAAACGGDYFLAARVVSAVATGAAAGFAFVLVRLFAGTGIAWFVLAGLMLNPVFLRYGIEAGTDAPAAAMMLAATWAVLRARSAGWLVAGGLLAGWAVVTRANAAFLIPAGAMLVAVRPRRLRGLALYLGAALLPSLLWSALCLNATGHLVQDRNYLNVAYELYGRDLPWDRFEVGIGSRFHSLFDVVAYDPGHAAGRILWNLAAHFARDLNELVPLGIGILVPPGMLLVARRREWRPALLHAGACGLALAPVFYSSRFSIYLLPFGLAAAGALLSAAPAWWARRRGAFGGSAIALRTVQAVAATVLLVSGVMGAWNLVRHLAEAPRETRIAGEWLRGHGFAGARIMARKPHVAYFAGMEHSPMPLATSMIDLLTKARADRAQYLFFSPIEGTQRPDFAVLGDSSVSLPGLDPIRFERVEENHFYALYRVRDEAVDSTAMAVALEAALVRYAKRRPGDPAAQVLVATQLLNLGRHREALERLLALERAGARDPVVAELLSNAYLELGDLPSARRECRLAMQIAPNTAWHYARLGMISEREGRLREAESWYERAVRAEPANVDHLARLGFANMALARYPLAASAFERCVRLAPKEASFRRWAMGAQQFAGNEKRAHSLFEEGLRAGIAAPAMLEGTSGARAASTR